MTRTTRNSQRAASEAVPPLPPPTRNRPSSKTTPAESAVPFPTIDDETPPQAEEKTPSPRRRSAGMAPRPVVDPSAPTTVPVLPPAPTTPFRRPPTGSRAKRTILGDLIPQPPLPPAPVDDSVEEEEDRSPSPDDTEIGSPHRILCRKYTEEPELQDLQDIYWKSKYPVVQSAWGVRPTRHEQVKYYQENEWDTDEEEYPEPALPDEESEWQPERSPYELFEGESWMRNMKIKEKFKRVVSKHHKLRMFEFSAPNEGPKIRLAEDTGKGQVWVGVKASPKKSPPRSTACVVDVDENGAPLYDEPASNGEFIADIKAVVHPSTGLPTAEYLASQLNELMQEAKLAQEEFQAIEKNKATIYGELLIEKEELEEEMLELDLLWKRLEAIVDPDFFEALQRCPHGKKPKIREPFLGGEPKDISATTEEGEATEGVEGYEGEDEDDDTDVEGDGEDEDADEEADAEIDPFIDGSDSTGADEDEDDGEDRTNPSLSMDIADTTGNKLEQTRRKPKALTREKSIDAAALAELIAGLNPATVTAANTTATTSASTNTTDQDDGEGEGDSREKEKSLILEASLDAEAFARGLLGEPDWQSTPPRPTTATSNENENAVPRKGKTVIRERSTLLALAEKPLPPIDAPTPTGSDDEDSDVIEPPNLPETHGVPPLGPQAIADALARAHTLPNPATTQFQNILPPSPQQAVGVVTTTADAKENALHTPVNTPYVPMRLSPATPSRMNGQPSTLARTFAASYPMGPRRRVRSSARIALQTVQSPQKDSDDEDEADQDAENERQAEERERARPAFEVYTGPSLPTDAAEHDRVTHQVKKECIEVVLRDQVPIHDESYDWDEFYGQAKEEDKREQKDEKVTGVVLPVVPQFEVWVRRENEEFDAAQKASGSEDEGEKNLPRRTSFIRESMLKRGRDESDDEDSGNDADENEGSGIASKKRRFSGSYGASDERTPVASASQAERSRKAIYETDEASRNRPSSNLPKNSDLDDCEEEDHVESILSAVSRAASPSSSRAGSPITLGELSLTYPQGPFSGAQFRTMRGGHSSAGDVEMSDTSDEDMEGVKATPRPVPPALTPAPPVSPRAAAPAIVGRRQLPRSVRDMMRYSKPVNFRDLRK